MTATVNTSPTSTLSDLGAVSPLGSWMLLVALLLVGAIAVLALYQSERAR